MADYSFILQDNGTGEERGTCTVTITNENILAENGQTIPITVTVLSSVQAEGFKINVVSKLTGRIFAESESATILPNVSTTYSSVITVTNAENAFLYLTDKSALTTIEARSSSVHSYPSTETALKVVRYRQAPDIHATIIRCDADGTPNDSGVNALVSSFKLVSKDGYPLTEAGLTTRTIRIVTGSTSRSLSVPSAILTAAISSAGYSESAPALLQGITFNNTADYTLTFTIGTTNVTSTLTCVLAGDLVSLHISSCHTGGVCVGGFSGAVEGSPRFECYFPAYFYGGSALTGIRARPELRSNVSLRNDTDTAILTHTVSEAGTYLIIAQGRFTSNATGRRSLTILKTDADGSNETNIGYQAIPAVSGKVTTIQACAATQITAGQKVILQANQNSGGALNITGNSAGTYTHMTFVRLL